MISLAHNWQKTADAVVVGQEVRNRVEVREVMCNLARDVISKDTQPHVSRWPPNIINTEAKPDESIISTPQKANHRIINGSGVVLECR